MYAKISVYNLFYGGDYILNNRKLNTLFSKWQLYVFLIIPLAYILIFSYIPMMGIQIAFKDFTARGGIWGSEWVGFKHFEKFFTSYQFSRVIKNTLVLSLYSLIVGFPIPIILALMLNAERNQGYKKVVQTVTYLPHFISMVVLVGMITQFLNPRIGFIPQILSAVFGGDSVNFMASPKAFPHIYVWSGIWQSVGWNSIIYMAALSGTDIQLHEAAEIDGASRFKRVLYIDLPVIIPTAVILLILNSGQIMNVGFEKIFLMQNNLNISASEVISTYVYDVGLASSRANFSYGTAIGLFNSVINFILIITVNTISKRSTEQSLW